MSNVLFALYHDFSANSAVHVHHFANELRGIGHDVAVAVPSNKLSATTVGDRQYKTAEFAEVDGDWAALFANGMPPDVVHAWTPRENVRLFCEKLRGLCTFVLVVHLEDNEELILEVNLGQPFRKLELSSSLRIPHNLSHPRNYRRFIASATGVTMIMDRLDRFVPETTPRAVLWPGADRNVFFPQAKDQAFLKELGVANGDTVLCYTGNVHSANAREVRSLYLAVAMLNREGHPATLIRTGRDFCPFLGEDDSWAKEHCVELGHLQRHEQLGRVLALADVLIQPGSNDEFNEYRLPAKLPEFFALGRPVILPDTNVGRFARHGEDAWVLPKVDALRIIETVTLLREDRELRERLSAGAVRFCDEHFDWAKNARGLAAFYESLLRDNGKARES